ncbi:MAG: class III poly(R)-hydroxyalkanoic acid synthase subunit PhaE [Dokdonella sp.]|uniref:class III poly(R)-hydroxyalkanoic acid synthase subunit PhaE n=1 Tax=Dokdonella sp. TaxID=2291710 RepID=UPI0032639D70
MSDLPHSDWMNQWQTMARQYRDAWQQMGRVPDAAPLFAMPSWPQGFEQMAKGFSAGGNAQNNTVENLVSSAKMYAAFMQSMLGATMQGNASPDWGDALRQGFASMGAGATMPAGLFGHPSMAQWQAGAGQGSDPFAQFRQAMGNLRMPAANGLGDFKSMLELPAFGMMRERQEQQQESAIAWLDYQEQTARYNALMLKASQRGFELFEGKLTEREQPGRQIDSMRALYDLWVDAAEEGYAEIALSKEFREIYGAMVNAQMRVRSHVQHSVERVATEFGMPTRSEINSIGERLQSLRREVRAKGTDHAIAAEVASLRQEVAQLKARETRQSRTTIVQPVDWEERPVRTPTTAATTRPGQPASSNKATRAKAKGKAVSRVVETSQPAGRRRAARSAKAVSPTLAKPKKRKVDQRGARKSKAVAATAKGSFASRVQTFTTASRGQANSRSKWKLAEKPADPAKKSGH